MALDLRQAFFSSLITLLAAVGTSGCIAGTPLSQNPINEGDVAGSDSGSGGGDPGDGVPGSTGGGANVAPFVPFEAQGPSYYVQKIKTLLTGLPASNDEVSAGSSAGGLSSLVDTWMQTSAYQDTLMDFFKLSFQMSLFKMEQISAQIPYGNHAVSLETPMLMESFPRTVLDIVNNDRPFTEVATTTQFMVTPRLLFMYALIDQFGDGATSSTAYYYKITNPNVTLVMTNRGGGANVNEITDPSSPNFLVFPWPTFKGSPSDPNCATDKCMVKCGSVTITPSTFTYHRGGNIWNMLTGGAFIYYTQPGNNFCSPSGSNLSYLTAADNTSWRMVNFRTPNSGEIPTQIYDINKFRTASEMVFRIPRVGFYTQPAFLAQWNTNINNQARSTINQTLAVGLDRVFDGSDRTTPTDLRALPLDHAAPNSSCYGCHVTMDPMRQYFLQTMSYDFHNATNPNLKAIPGAWGQNGVTVAGGNINQLGAQIAADPDFAIAWVAKACAYLNSGPCDKSDPEMQRIAASFSSGGFKFNAMFKDLLTSPLTTYSQPTQTAIGRGVAPTIARSAQFCKLVGQRINQPAICSDSKIAALLRGYPTDGYSRGTTALNQSREPSLVTRLALENICVNIAVKTIDSASSPQFSSKDPVACVKNIMTGLMGVDPNDEPDMLALLNTHVTEAKAAGLSQADALRSCFTVACLSPYVATIGQ